VPEQIFKKALRIIEVLEPTLLSHREAGGDGKRTTKHASLWQSGISAMVNFQFHLIA
jgi:hypothetical protein